MNRETNLTRLLLGLLLVICTGSGCALGLVPLSAAPIDSQVVDADTGKPIEGAVVVAYWELNPGGLTGDSLPCGAANVEEAVTDKDGKFHLPGWGPTMPACPGYMREGEPMLFVFKEGYHYGRFDNGLGIAMIARTGSTWGNNRQMKLKKFQVINYQDLSSANGVVSDFEGIDIDMGLFIIEMPSQCNWKKIPNMLRVLEHERRKISAALGYPVDGITANLVDDNRWFEKVAPQCGSPKAFIEGLLK